MGMGSLLNKLLQNQNQHVSHCLRRKEPKKLWEMKIIVLFHTLNGIKKMIIF